MGRTILFVLYAILTKCESRYDDVVQHVGEEQLAESFASATSHIYADEDYLIKTED